MGRKPPAFESRSEGNFCGQTQGTGRDTDFPVSSWMQKKHREERERWLAVFRAQDKKGRDKEGEAAGPEQGRALEDEAAKWLRTA